MYLANDTPSPKTESSPLEYTSFDDYVNKTLENLRGLEPSVDESQQLASPQWPNT
jgi:hypothetical protein